MCQLSANQYHRGIRVTPRSAYLLYSLLFGLFVITSTTHFVCYETPPLCFLSLLIGIILT